MSLIRPRQHAITGLFPHNANRRFVIPKRKQGPVILQGNFGVIDVTFVFDVAVTGGDEVGFTLFNNTDALPVAIVSAVNGTPPQIIITYAAQTLGDSMTVTYKPGAWTSARGQVNGFTFSGDVK